MKFLVKPINNKFEGYCFGNSHAKLDSDGECFCAAHYCYCGAQHG